MATVDTSHDASCAHCSLLLTTTQWNHHNAVQTKCWTHSASVVSVRLHLPPCSPVARTFESLLQLQLVGLPTLPLTALGFLHLRASMLLFVTHARTRTHTHTEWTLGNCLYRKRHTPPGKTRRSFLPMHSSTTQLALVHSQFGTDHLRVEPRRGLATTFAPHVLRWQNGTVTQPSPTPSRSVFH